METNNNNQAVITLPMLTQAELPAVSHSLIRVLATALLVDHASEQIGTDELRDYLYLLDNTIKSSTDLCIE